jgi:transposase
MKPRTESNLSSPVFCVGVDIGKEMFHLVGFAADGKIAFRRMIRRLGLKDALEKLPPCIVGMEACLSARILSAGRHVRRARALQCLGNAPKFLRGLRHQEFAPVLVCVLSLLGRRQRLAGERSNRWRGRNQNQGDCEAPGCLLDEQPEGLFLHRFAPGRERDHPLKISRISAFSPVERASIRSG